MDEEALTDERRLCVRRSRVVLAPQRSGVKLATMLGHRVDDGGKRWFTEESTYKP